MGMDNWLRQEEHTYDLPYWCHVGCPGRDVDITAADFPGKPVPIYHTCSNRYLCEHFMKLRLDENGRPYKDLRPSD